MNFIGDFFAIGIVIVLCMFFFDGKHLLTKASRFFVLSLVFTALTAAIDLLTGYLLYIDNTPLWFYMLANTVYFLTNIITTSIIGLYLFTKILEHSYNDHCMIYAKQGLLILFVIYAGFVIANIWTGWLFYFDENQNYCRGPLNALGYSVTICQMILVLICYGRNRKNASKTMRRVLIQTFPVVVLCIIVQRIFPEIMLNGYIMAMVETILFLNFQGQRQGVHVLTNLNDRHRFFDDMATRIAANESFQVFLINIKNFSAINHKYGHFHGDEVLYQLAFALETLIKNSVSYHMNGTVFSLVIPYSSQSYSDACCGSLLYFLDQGIPYMNDQIHFDYLVADYIVDGTVSDTEVFYERLEYAITLAYNQKCRYIRCTPEIGTAMDRRKYLLKRMKAIDEAHGFCVWYQPICCLNTGKFCSMEALIRLQEADGTLISPAEFIPIAEKSGIVSSVTWFVIEQVCKFLRDHPEIGDVSTSINLPMPQLLEKGFVSRLNSIVNLYGVDHHRICLEFTERDILDTFQQTREIMQQLNANGYRFYLDDFGTGYSNFNCLLHLPLSVIKLDASLVHAATSEQGDFKLVQTVTELSHNMGIQVIAEGVETRSEVDALGSMGIDRIQGYAFAKPMSGDALLDFYRNNPT